MNKIQIGDECPRCYGHGEVYNEVFEYEWAECPYFNFESRIGCLGGIIVPEVDLDETQH